MSIQQLLASMCAALPDADLNAIRKARNFSASETASRTAFGAFYTTSIGLVEVIQSLSLEEVLTLRMLLDIGEVDVSFFERVYDRDNSYFHGTYTQLYKSVFETVKKKLVRRGLVIMAEVKLQADVVQLQRWRFAIPPEFGPYLPSLPVVQDARPGQTNETLARHKLLEVLSSKAPAAGQTLKIEIKQGNLNLNDKPFSLNTLLSWQLSLWADSQKLTTSNLVGSLSPVIAAVKLLPSTDWMAPNTLVPALKVYCPGTKLPNIDSFLKDGHAFGLLSSLNIDQVTYYRHGWQAVIPAENSDLPASLDWAEVNSKVGGVQIDLERIPLRSLEPLNQLAHLAVEKDVLIASPSLARLGRTSVEQRASPLARWLAAHHPGFASALATVNERWGKTILHENLLFARVRDLSLRVQLERELKDRVVLLNDHFIAFPLDARGSVEKILRKTGFVVKTVKP
jgi:hypothetical protein